MTRIRRGAPKSPYTTLLSTKIGDVLSNITFNAQTDDWRSAHTHTHLYIAAQISCGVDVAHSYLPACLLPQKLAYKPSKKREKCQG